MRARLTRHTASSPVSASWVLGLQVFPTTVSWCRCLCLFYGQATEAVWSVAWLARAIRCRPRRGARGRRFLLSRCLMEGWPCTINKFIKAWQQGWGGLNWKQACSWEGGEEEGWYSVESKDFDLWGRSWGKRWQARSLCVVNIQGSFWGGTSEARKEGTLTSSWWEPLLSELGAGLC